MTISWREICGAMPSWSLAGRRSTPSSGTLAQQRAGGVAAFVQFASSFLNHEAVNVQIYQQLQQASVDQDLESLLSGESSGRGVHAMASYVQYRHPDGQWMGANVNVNLYRATYASAEDVVRSMRSTGTVRAESSRPNVRRLVHRYFWGVHLEADQPRYIGGTMRGSSARRRRAARRGPGPRVKPI